MNLGRPTAKPSSPGVHAPKPVKNSFSELIAAGLSPKNLVLYGAILVMLWLALAPMFMLIWGSLRSADPGVPGATFTLSNYVRAFTEPFVYSVLWNTLVYSFGSTLVSVVVGVGLAWFVERTNIFLRNLIFILVVIRIAVPQMMMTIAWILLLSPNSGWINHIIQSITGIEKLINIYSMGGMIWVEGIDKAPVVFLLASAAFRSLDPTFEEAALMCGARLKSIIRYITLPIIIPAIAAGILLAFLTNLESFEVPTLIGLREGIQTFSSAIYFLTTGQKNELTMASTYGMVFFVIAAIGLYLYQKMTAESKKFMTITGKGYRPTRIDLGPWRWPLSLLIVIFLLFSYILPIFILSWTSLLPFYSIPSYEALQRISLENFEFIFKQGTTNRALQNSLFLAVLAGTLVIFLTGILSWMLVRTRSLLSRLVDMAIFIPITFPGIVLGLSLMWTYIILPIGVYGTLWILLIAYLTKFMPQGMRFTNSAALQVHSELEEAAMVHGASWWQAVRSITFPLMGPGLLVGWLYVVAYAFREVPVSILLYSPGNEVIAVNAFNLWQNGASGASTAIGVVIVLIIGVVAGMARLLARKTGVSTD